MSIEELRNRYKELGALIAKEIRGSADYKAYMSEFVEIRNKLIAVNNII